MPLHKSKNQTSPGEDLTLNKCLTIASAREQAEIQSSCIAGKDKVMFAGSSSRDQVNHSRSNPPNYKEKDQSQPFQKIIL